MTKYAKVRAWLHGIAVAALPVLVSLGYLTNDDVPMWAALIGAVLVPGLGLVDAAKHDKRVGREVKRIIDTGEMSALTEKEITRGKHTSGSDQ